MRQVALARFMAKSTLRPVASARKRFSEKYGEAVTTFIFLLFFSSKLHLSKYLASGSYSRGSSARVVCCEKCGRIELFELSG